MLGLSSFNVKTRTFLVALPRQMRRDRRYGP